MVDFWMEWNSSTTIDVYMTFWWLRLLYNHIRNGHLIPLHRSANVPTYSYLLDHPDETFRWQREGYSFSREDLCCLTHFMFGGRRVTAHLMLPRSWFRTSETTDYVLTVDLFFGRKWVPASQSDTMRWVDWREEDAVASAWLQPHGNLLLAPRWKWHFNKFLF